MSEHANGSKSVIAAALGGTEAADSWYEAATEVLEALTEAGYIICKRDEMCWSSGDLRCITSTCPCYPAGRTADGQEKEL